MRAAFALFTLVAVASCVAAPPPTPPPARAPVAAAPRPAPAPPLASDWRDWPQTAGDWRYVADRPSPVAQFRDAAGVAFEMACERDARRIRLVRHAGSSGALTIRTSSLVRRLPAEPSTRSGSQDRSAISVDARLAAGDPLLDAIGFSRGRFVVEQADQPPLVLPAWAEVERVIEDCRA